MISSSAYQNLRKDLEIYFNYDILQFASDIASPEIMYSGNAYCWVASTELFLFNPNLEFLNLH